MRDRCLRRHERGATGDRRQGRHSLIKRGGHARRGGCRGRALPRARRGHLWVFRWSLRRDRTTQTHQRQYLAATTPAWRDRVLRRQIRLDEYFGDGNVDVEDVGSLWEVGVRQAPTVAFRPLTSRSRSKASSTSPGSRCCPAIGPVTNARRRRRQRRPRVGPPRHLRRGFSHGEEQARPQLLLQLPLNHDAAPVSLETLTDTPWVIEWDYGGAHGGDPLACADLG